MPSRQAQHDRNSTSSRTSGRKERAAKIPARISPDNADFDFKRRVEEVERATMPRVDSEFDEGAHRLLLAFIRDARRHQALIEEHIRRVRIYLDVMELKRTRRPTW